MANQLIWGCRGYKKMSRVDSLKFMLLVNIKLEEWGDG